MVVTHREYYSSKNTLETLKRNPRTCINNVRGYRFLPCVFYIHSPVHGGIIVAYIRQVFWLPDLPICHTFPSFRTVVFHVAFVPGYSGGPATDFHRLPLSAFSKTDYRKKMHFAREKNKSDIIRRKEGCFQQLPYRYQRQR